MRRILAILAVALSIGGCSTLQTFQQVATSTVPASVVVPVANAFDILKGTATNYGRYCISQHMVPAVCSADIRRKVVKSVRAGTGARNQLEGSVTRGEPALASIYNVLVAAVQGLQASPVTDPMFAGGAK